MKKFEYYMFGKPAKEYYDVTFDDFLMSLKPHSDYKLYKHDLANGVETLLGESQGWDGFAKITQLEYSKIENKFIFSKWDRQWDIIGQFLPKYHGRSDVAHSDDLTKYIDGEWNDWDKGKLMALKQECGNHNSQEAKDYRDAWDNGLYIESIDVLLTALVAQLREYSDNNKVMVEDWEFDLRSLESFLKNR